MRVDLTAIARRLRHTRRARLVAEIAGAVLLLSGGAAFGSVAAAPSATSTTIHGCENTKTGALSVRLRATCPRGTRALSWNITGPRGPAGTTAFGTATNTATANTNAGNTCTLGEALLMPGKTLGDNTIPADGQLLSISTNTALFSLYGTRYGGDGITTFAVPNLMKAAPNGLTYAICVAGVFP